MERNTMGSLPDMEFWGERAVLLIVMISLFLYPDPFHFSVYDESCIPARFIFSLFMAAPWP